MAYGRRKGAKRVGKGAKGVSRLAKGKSTAITTLAKTVKSIQRQIKLKSVMLNYGQKWDYQTLSSNVDYFHLNSYSQWDAIFGSAGNDGEANKVIHKSFGLDVYIDANSETDNTHFTVFLVSLKDQHRAGMFNVGNGSLSLSNNTDYYTNGGFAMINKASFNIHAVRRFTLGNNGVGLGSSTAQLQFGSDRRFYLRQRCNKVIASAGAGDWRGMNCSADPSDNYYLLVFNDNGILDATYPRIRINVVHTVEQLS